MDLIKQRHDSQSFEKSVFRKNFAKQKMFAKNPGVRFTNVKNTILVFVLVPFYEKSMLQEKTVKVELGEFQPRFFLSKFRNKC